MSMLLFIVVLCALCALLIHVVSCDRDGPASSIGTASERPDRTGARPVPGDDLIGTTGNAWTVLDDHQLNRLLKDSSP